MNLAIAFISPAGVTLDQGLTTFRRPLADTLNAARASAAQTVALMDASKFGRVSLLTVARAQDVDLLITDDALPEATAEEFRAAGLALEVTPRAEEDVSE